MHKCVYSERGGLCSGHKCTLKILQSKALLGHCRGLGSLVTQNWPLDAPESPKPTARWGGSAVGGGGPASPCFSATAVFP